ncbi:MAG TPA: tryptophan--tRNA ligase [Alphaproteobacteria bacterium]|nr:tryptophan--tRNA ligase [Alphaproteobacteria bacterium]
MQNKTVLTGVKPTGTPHIGNLVGAIKPAIDLGNKVVEAGGRHFMFVADYHAINAEKDPAVLNQKLKEIACIYLAFGLDPNKSVFYRQSDIPEIPEITTILFAHTPKGFMNKAHAYKAAVDKNRAAGKPDDDLINMGLYTYPTLMASDILAYDTDIVPVGKDQVQHVEIARDIAGMINAHYGKQLLKLPEYSLTQNAILVPGVDGRKMSKSYNNVIPIFADKSEIKKAVFSIKTDSRPMEEPKNPDEILVYQIYQAIAAPDKVQEMAEGLKQGKLGYGHIKNMLLDAVVEMTSDAKEKYDYYMAHFDEVEEMLALGASKARPIATQTLNRLKNAVFGR